MRLLGRRRPERPWCDCRLCRPGGEQDERDRKAVRDVREHLVHLVLVSDAHECACEHEHEPPQETGPDFVYTVGLWHQRQHPELLLSGIPRRDVMHRVLNELARRVVEDGLVLAPGRAYEDVLSGVPVCVEELTPEGRAETTTWSAWFHRQDVPALQVVWPDLDGLFAWQGGADILDERQPPQWRVAGPRSGALAPEPPWPFPVPRETLAFACRHVAEGELPVLYAQRDRDDERGEDWSVSCGAEHETGELTMWHLHHALTRCPGLSDVAGLPLDHWAGRPDARSPWVVSAMESEG